MLSGIRPTLWICGIVLPTFLIACAGQNSVKDQLTVHLINADKKPVTASVIVQEKRRYPILRPMTFLPQWARASTRSNHVNVIDGIVKVRRVNGPRNETVLIIRAKMKPSEFLVFIIGETNAANVYLFQRKVGRITREQADVSVMLE
jgi:hypothetical protein